MLIYHHALVTEALRWGLKWTTTLCRNRNQQIKEGANPERRNASSNAVVAWVCERPCCVLLEIPSSHWEEMEAEKTTQPTVE